MTRTLRLLLLLPLAAVLAGCEIDNAAYMIDGKEHALILNREKPYFWSSEYKLAIVVSNMPSCQRRYDLKPARLAAANVSVYDGGEPGRYLLRQGSRWYAVNSGNCAFAVVQAPDVRPALVGVYRRKDDALAFVPSKPADTAADEDG